MWADSPSGAGGVRAYFEIRQKNRILYKNYASMVVQNNQIKDIQQITDEITLLVRQFGVENNGIHVHENILTKSIAIIETIGITDEFLLCYLDYFVNAHGTISLELECTEDEKDIYLHIEVGTTMINWQFRMKGKRIDQMENILHANNEDVERGIALYNDYL